MNMKSDKNWININYISKQEEMVKHQTEDFFGKGRNGFCDIALDGIELLLQGIGYLRNEDYLESKDGWNNFNHALRTLTFYQYYRITYTFKASYNLFSQGYYTEASILMRHIIETFIRLRYIAKERNIQLIDLTFAGHRGFKDKKFKITYKAQFDKIAPGLYKYYQILCDIAHGAMASYILKTKIVGNKVLVDTGVIFKPEDSTFITNQFYVYLLAHLEFMMWVFPEIKVNMPENYAEKYHKTLGHIWSFMKEISQRDKNKEWYSSVKQIVNI